MMRSHLSGGFAVEHPVPGRSFLKSNVNESMPHASPAGAGRVRGAAQQPFIPIGFAAVSSNPFYPPSQSSALQRLCALVAWRIERYALADAFISRRA
jgi:hypothetical protein